MHWLRCCAGLALAGLLAPACNATYDPDGFTEEDWVQIRALASAPPLPASPENRFADSPAAADLGHRLFFDRGLSPPLPDGGTVACGDCHAPERYFSDGHAGANVSMGFGFTKRNSPSLVDVALYPVFAWDGRGRNLWLQCDIAYVAPATMRGTAALLRSAILDRYLLDYLRLFGGSPESLGTPAAERELRTNVAFLWEAYLRQLRGGPGRFERFARGEPDAGFTDANRRGLRAFLVRGGCITCHRGPNFSDGQFYSVGIGQTGPNVQPVDRGEWEGLKFLQTYDLAPSGQSGDPPAATSGRFRTRSLRNVELTAPYFHAGQLATLDEVVRFYNRGGDHAGASPENGAPFMVPLGLTDDEVDDLVSFLRTLTSDLPEARLRCDTSLPPGSGGQACP
jgi:cytochrome c peroxidase